MYQTYGSNAMQATPGAAPGVIPGFNNQGAPGYGQQAGYNQQGYNNAGYGQQNNTGGNGSNGQQQVNNGEYNLAQINDVLVNAAPQKNVETPTGTYQVKVAKVEMKRSQSTNNPMIFWLLEHISGEYIQATERLYDVIPVNLDFNYPENVQRLRKKFGLIKGRFQTCGVDTSAVQSIEGFQNLFPAVLDATLEIRKMVKGENSNIYFNKRIFINGQQPAQGNTGNVIGFPGMPGGNGKSGQINNQNGGPQNSAPPTTTTQQNNGQQYQQPQQSGQNGQMGGQQNNQGNQAPQGASQPVQSTAAPQVTQSVQAPVIRDTTPPPANHQAPQGQMPQGQMQNGQFQQGQFQQAPGGMPPTPPGMNQQMYQNQATYQAPGYNQNQQQQMQLPLDPPDEDEIVPDEFDAEDMPF